MFELENVNLPETNKLIREVAVGGQDGKTFFVIVFDDPRTGDWEVALYDEETMVRILAKRDKSAARDDDEVHKIHIDPFGCHVLISMESGDNYHASLAKAGSRGLRGVKAVKLSALSDIVIEAVGWNKSSRDGAFLLGDQRGVIWEARLDDKGCKKHRRWNLDDTGEGKAEPVTSLEVERFRGGGLALLATWRSRLFQFVGGNSLETLFSKEPSLMELPGDRSTLHLYRESLDKQPCAYAWSTAAGIMHGKLNLSMQNQQGSVLASQAVLALVNNPSFDTGRGLMVSKYFFYMLYRDKLLVVAQPPGLNWQSNGQGNKPLTFDQVKERAVWAHEFRMSDKHELQGLIQDQRTGSRYIYTKNSIYELCETYDDRTEHNTWKTFLTRAMDPKEPDRPGYFAVARELSHGKLRRARVTAAEGDYYFEQGEYGRAADIYSKCMQARPFEATALKFIAHNRQEELLSFALFVLEDMKKAKVAARDKASQIVCICMWIVQLYLQKLNETPDKQAYRELQEEFRSFVADNLEDVDKLIVSNMIATSAQPDEFMFFIELLCDYRRLIGQYITHGRFSDALDCLLTHCYTERYRELWYQFSPRLIQREPVKLVSGWMKLVNGRSFFKPARLIPALLKYDVKDNPPGVKEDQAIRYLEWLVNSQQCRDPAIHNLLLSRYAAQPSGEQLLQFLKRDECYYDERYALRLCLANNQHRACVDIYSAMHLFEDAVKFALKTEDVRLAEEVALEAHGNRQEKKRLWLHIAQHVIEQKGNREAIQLLSRERAGRVLALEDILPYFKDFTRIQDYKAEICEALKAYQEKTRRARERLDEEKAGMDEVQRDLVAHRQLHHYVNETDKCSSCWMLVLGDSFVAYPACGHEFHKRCLAKETATLLETAQAAAEQRVLQGGCGPEAMQKARAQAKLVKEYISGRTKYSSELAELLEAECPFCGKRMINEVDTPLTLGSDPSSWKVM